MSRKARSKTKIRATKAVLTICPTLILLGLWPGASEEMALDGLTGRVGRSEVFEIQDARKEQWSSARLWAVPANIDSDKGLFAQEPLLYYSRMNATELLTSGKPFLTFGGVETYLVFQRDFALPEFGAFKVLEDEAELANLKREFVWPTLDAARAHGFGLVCDCLLWRAAPDYIVRLGHSANELGEINKKAVVWMREVVAEWRGESGASAEECPIVLGAEVGPRGDGYALAGQELVSADAAYEYHSQQLRAFRAAEVDVVFALTMTSASEATGIVRAAREQDLAIVVSATVETNGALPDGGSLRDFIETVDDETEAYPIFYMVNCAHPSHLEPTLAAAQRSREPWFGRFKGLRANASTKSHDELDNSTKLDAGDADDLAVRLADMSHRFGLSLLGGCCGTDSTHLRAIAAAAER